MRCLLLSCLTAALLQPAVARAEDETVQTVGLRSLKRAFYQAVNRHVMAEAREAEADDEEPHDRAARRKERERKELEQRERERARDREAREQEEARERNDREPDRERERARRREAAERARDAEARRRHEQEDHHARHEMHMEYGRPDPAHFGGMMPGVHHGHAGPHSAGFPHPPEQMVHPGVGPHFMPGQHPGGPHPQPPQVVYVIVASAPPGGLPSWLGHLGPHAGRRPIEHRRAMDEDDEDEDEDEEDERREKEIAELREQVQLLRKEVHVMAEILKELKRDR